MLARRAGADNWRKPFDAELARAFRFVSSFA